MISNVCVMSGRSFSVFYVFVFLLAIVGSSAAQEQLPQTVSDLQGLAKQNIESGNYTAAIENYRAIIQLVPESQEAMDAQSGIGVLCAEQDNFAGVQAAVSAICGQYSEQPAFVMSIRRVADVYASRKNYTQALRIYDHAAELVPAHSDLVWLTACRAELYLKLKEFDKADAIVNGIWDIPASETALSKAICQLCRAYVVEKPEKTLDLGRRLLRDVPGTEMEQMAVQDSLVNACLKLNRMDEARKEIDVLLNTYQSIEHSQVYAFNHARRFRDNKDYTTAIGICRHLITICPESKEAYSWNELLADCAIRCENQSLSDATIQVLFDRYSERPDFADKMSILAQRYQNMFKGQSYVLEIYGDLMRMFPLHEKLVQIHAGKIKAMIACGMPAEIQTELEQFFTNCRGSKDFFEQAFGLSRSLESAGEYARAIECSVQAVLSDEYNEKAIRAEQMQVSCHLAMDNVIGADAVVNRIIEKRAAEKDFVKVLNEIAHRYRMTGNYARAVELNRVVTASTEDPNSLLWAHTEIAQNAVKLSDEVRVYDEINLLFDRFKDVGIARSLFVIGEEYYLAAHKNPPMCSFLSENSENMLPKAIAIWQRIVNDLPGCDYEARAWYFIGLSNFKLHNTEDALWGFEKSIEGPLEVQFAQSAQLLIGECYERLDVDYTDPDKVREADLGREQAYLNLVEKYPESPAVSGVCYKLGFYYTGKGQLEKAISFFNKCTEVDKGSLGIRACFRAGQCYEKLGQYADATLMYFRFIQSAHEEDPLVEKATDSIARLAGAQNTK